MQCTIESGDLERAQRVIARRIMRIAFPEEGGIDRRDAMALADRGLIHPDATAEPDNIYQLLDLEQEEGADALFLGPLIFYQSNQKGISNAKARDLLLCDRLKLRQVAVAHIERVAASNDLVSLRTKAELERLKPLVLVEDDGVWRRASIELADAIDEDWLLNIAGVRQCSRPEMQDMWSKYITAVLRPSIASVNAFAPNTLCPGLNQDAIAAVVIDLAANSRSVLELCQSYLETVGHVPLNSECALSSVLLVWQEHNPGPDSLKEVFDWAESSNNPLARYHACEIALALDSQLSSEQRDQTAHYFWEAVFPSGVLDDPTKGHSACGLANQLARYYIHYLEVRLPSDCGEAIAAMAWRMTSRLTEVITEHSSSNQSFGEQLDTIHGSIACDIWDLVEPPMTPSTLSCLTVFGPSPWALSIMSAVPNEQVFQRLLNGLGPGTSDNRQDAIMAIAIKSGGLSLEESGYQFSCHARRTLAWAADSEQDEDKRKLLKGWADSVDWSSSESLAESLGELNQQEVPVQQWLCHSIRQAMAAGDLTGDGLWDIVSSGDWKDSRWLEIDLISLQALGCALIDDASRRTPEWYPQLPHLLTEIAERRSENETDREACFAIVLKACCSLNSFSALSRLMRSSVSHRYRPLTTAFRGNVEQVLPQAGGWAAGRLRSMLVGLLQ